MSETVIIDKFIEPTKCIKVGHEGLQIQYIQNIGSVKEKLYCQNCIILNNPNQSTLVPLKLFLSNYLSLETKRQVILTANQQFLSAPSDQMLEFETQMSQKRDDESFLIEDNFIQLVKMTKIMFENAKDKFKMVNKNYYQRLKIAQDETKHILAKKDPLFRDRISTAVRNNPHKENNYLQVKETCDQLMSESSFSDDISIRDLLMHVPSFNIEKFNQIKEQILDFIKEKLKSLFEAHHIKMNDLSWHSRTAEMAAVYEGHTDHVLSLSVLNDGTLCSASKDKVVRTWDVVNNKAKDLIPFHNKNLNAICTMPDGRLAVAVENLIKFYNVQKEEMEKTLTGHVKQIQCLCPTLDGNLLSGGMDNVIKLWNVKTAQLIKTYYGHDDFVRAIKLTKDGKYFISSSDDKSVKVWDLVTGDVKKSFDSHSDYVYAIDVTEQGNIVTGSRDGTVKIWDIQSERCLQSIKAHKDFIYCLTILVDGYIATGSSDNTIKIWHPQTGELMKTLEGHQFPVRGLQVLQNGNLASCGEDNLVIIWAAQKLEVLNTMSGHTKAVWCVAGMSKERFVSGSEDRTAKVWDSQTGACIVTLAHKDQVRAVLFNFERNQIITGCMDKYVRFYHGDRFALEQQLLAHSAGVRSLSFTEDFDIISGGEDKIVKVWNKATYALINVLEGHDDYIRVVCGLKNKRICTGSRDNTLRVWQNGQQEMVLKGHKLPIWAIVDLRDGIWLGTGSSDYNIRIWNLEKQACETVLEGHTAPVWALLKFNDMLLISGSEDCNLKVWDWEYGLCVRTLLVHSYSVWGLGVTHKPDPKNKERMVPLLGTGSWDRSVKCLHLKKVQLSGQRAKKN